MNRWKQIATYFLWTMASFAIGMAYIIALFGPYKVPKRGIGYLLYLFFQWGMIYAGLVVGAILALSFILVDIFYLKKKLKNYSHPTIIRCGVLLGIMVFVMIAHYMLEKVINVI